MGIGAARQRSNNVLLFGAGAVLAELELGFHTGCNQLESDDVAQHPAAILLAERRPLIAVL